MKSQYQLPVPSITDGLPRPMWSVLIPTHNCATYLQRTLVSVLQQDPGSDHMQIIVIDDYSTEDDPEKTVREIAGNRVEFIRQSQNIGKSRNYQTGLNASRGKLIHQLHGDDMVQDSFYESMETCFIDNPNISAFFCASDYIDENDQIKGCTGSIRKTTGHLEHFIENIYSQQLIQTPSIVLRRDVYEQLGGFDNRLNAFEDWEMWIRVANQFEFGFNASTKASYRVYPENTSHQSMLDGTRGRTRELTLKIVDRYVPNDIQKRCRKARSNALAEHLCCCLPIAVKHMKPSAWLTIFLGLLRHTKRPRLLLRAIRMSLQFHRFS